MRGSLDGDVIEDLSRAISVLDLNLATITGMLGSTRLLELDAPIRTELGRFAKTLHDVGQGASRAAMLIDKANTDADAELALEWDLQRHLADGFTACRGLSIKARGFRRKNCRRSFPLRGQGLCRLANEPQCWTAS